MNETIEVVILGIEEITTKDGAELLRFKIMSLDSKQVDEFWFGKERALADGIAQASPEVVYRLTLAGKTTRPLFEKRVVGVEKTEKMVDYSAHS